jgi:hypothetical protein
MKTLQPWTEKNESNFTATTETVELPPVNKKWNVVDQATADKNI